MLSDASSDAEIKLIDFGLSKRFCIDDGLSEPVKKNFVKLQTVVGTPYYVAPEVLQ